MDPADDVLEDELLFDDDQGSQQASTEHGEDHSDAEQDTDMDKAGVDIAGTTSASHQSSTLRASLDDIDPSQPTPSPPIDMPTIASDRSKQQQQQQRLQQFTERRMAASVPVRAYTRLGTSAPINIPNMARWRGREGSTAAESGGGGADSSKGGGGDAEVAPVTMMASTFIPPHQLSRQDDFMFSFSGASPSACLKRDRLRSRNAILRSTGFIEPQGVLGGAGQPAAAAAAAASLDAAGSTMRVVPAQSTLTAALTTIGETG